MSQPRDYQTEAIVLRKTRLGEADRILTLYTPHLGKIQAFAKSIRKPKSKMAGHLEMITHSQVQLIRGRNLDTVTGARTIHGFYNLKTDLWQASRALYISELVERFTPDQMENQPVFELLLATLEHLQAGDTGDLLLRLFELRLLDLSGYRPHLEACTVCARPLVPGRNWFSPVSGGLLCADCGHQQPVRYPLSGGAERLLVLLQSGNATTARRIRPGAKLAREVEQVIRRYLRYLLEREINSAFWLDRLRVTLEGRDISVNDSRFSTGDY